MTANDTIWKVPFTIENLNAFRGQSILPHLGIEFTEAGADYLSAKMPVDHRTHQPFGLLHGGASCVLAETLGSMASALSAGADKMDKVVGVEINANHLRAVRKGIVTGTARPIRLGRRIHVWEIRMKDDEQRLCCISRLTTLIGE